jgi:hypothetical protein
MCGPNGQLLAVKALTISEARIALNCQASAFSCPRFVGFVLGWTPGIDGKPLY